MRHSVLPLLAVWFLLSIAAGWAGAAEPCTPFEARRVDTALLAEMRDAARQGRLYRIVPGRSRVEFCVRHFPFREFRGTFTRLVGGLTLPPEAGQHGRALLLVHTTSMQSNNPDLDALVLSHEFMDVRQFPEILFVGTDFEWYGPARAWIHGELTLHGVTRPVTFNAEIGVLEKDNDNGALSLLLKGASQVSRTEFDMRGYPLLVSETVRLCLSVELARWDR